jgi:para-aminobenzoate synthetase component 1
LANIVKAPTEDACGATLVERLDGSIDAVDVFRRWSNLPHAVFFDSSARDSALGRYSFVAADPIEWWTAEAGGDGAAAFEQVGRLALALSGDWRPDLPPFQGGVAGMFGYELADSFERVPAASIADFSVPVLAVGWYDVVAAFDHATGAAWLISQGWPERDPLARRERAAIRLDKFRRRLVDAPCAPRKPPADELPPLRLEQLAPQFAAFVAGGLGGLTSNFSSEDYLRAVRRAIEFVHAGDVFQVNLSQRLLHPACGSAVDLYCRLRARNRAPFSGFFDLGDWQICSASPERFLRVSDGRVETRPIKGTAPRTNDPAADDGATQRLLASEKDRAENVMIVDLLRNDLSRSCRPESVEVTQLCGLETYAWVRHLVSVVVGQLRDDQSPVDLFRHCFPGGSVTGAPKIRARQIIAELEPTLRGAYCGSLGYLGVHGEMDANLLIRTITAGRGWWQLPVGGGIVAQSDPQLEFEETWAKAYGMLRAINP